MEAAAHAEVDPMRGVSENIIMGQVEAVQNLYCLQRDWLYFVSY